MTDFTSLSAAVLREPPASGEFEPLFNRYTAAHPTLHEGPDGSLEVLVAPNTPAEVTADLNVAAKWLELFVAEGYLIRQGDDFLPGKRPLPWLRIHFSRAQGIALSTTLIAGGLIIAVLGTILGLLGALSTPVSMGSSIAVIVLAVVVMIVGFGLAIVGAMIADNNGPNGVVVEIGPHPRIYPAP